MNLRHFGWWWRKLGPVAILILTLLKFLPFIGYSCASIVELAYANSDCSLRENALHFWTVFSASFLEFLLLSLIYWWTLIVSKDHRKWRSGLVGSSILCSAVVLAALISSAVGWKLPWIRPLLLEVTKKAHDCKRALTINTDLATAYLDTNFATLRLHRKQPYSSGSHQGSWRSTGRSIKPISTCSQSWYWL